MELPITSNSILDDIKQLSFSRNLDQFLDSIIKVFSHINGIQSIRIDFFLSVFGYSKTKSYNYNSCNVHSENVTLKLSDGEGTIGSLTLTLNSSNSLNEFPVLMSMSPTVICERYKSFWLSSLLNTITSPISFDSSEEEFLSEISELLSDASGARIIIIRDYLPLEFACKGYYDSQSPKNKRRIPSIDKNNHPEAFKYLSDFIINARLDKYRKIQFLRQSPPLINMVKDIVIEEKVKSTLTVPLLKGEECRGIISFIFEEEIFESPFIEEAFLLLGNHTAVSIENFVKSAENANLLANGTRDFIEKVNFEIMQGLRHAAINNLSKLKGQISAIKNIDLKELEDMKESCRELTKDLDGMRALTSKYGQQKKLVSITECFKDACSILSYKIEPMGVKIKYSNKDESIWGVKSAITYAFVNVILNSIDSFGEGFKSAQKHINLNIVDSDEEILTFDISDNGVGFRAKGSVHSTQQIWQPGITTKKSGTGYGLPMVREVFQSIHGGTVRIMSTTGFTLRFQVFRFKSTSEKDQYQDSLKRRRN